MSSPSSGSQCRQRALPVVATSKESPRQLLEASATQASGLPTLPSRRWEQLRTKWRMDDQQHWDLYTARTPKGGCSGESWTMGESPIQQYRVSEVGQCRL
ncbi:hypothetical protein AMTR_s00253p00014670 [Amborella trichopoda]|uniref:Uncharacterized protein n=1 Tax=Amborella trichopoda TaxID=13333 RepID=W1NRR5_AMBTC|nr:hypothetical protein AMTR_s00253p00014670 [Amborella trichopoda]